MSDEQINENQEDVAVDNQQPSIEEELAHAKDQWLRAVAELENVRRRTQKEREEALKYGASSFAKNIIEVADNVQRALLAAPTFYEKVQSLPDRDFFISFINGVEMISKAFVTALESQGIKPVDSLNHPFDPNVHQALMEVESVDSKPGTIVQVIQEGYKMHDRLLRPALVGVAKAPSKPLEEESKLRDGHVKVTVDA